MLSGAGAIVAISQPAMLVAPNAEIGIAAHVFAGYFVARSLAFACVLLLLLVLRVQRVLGQLLALIGLVQFFDAIIDMGEGRWAVVLGVILLGILFLIAAARLCGSAFWHRSAWADCDKVGSSAA
ncbi:MAG TPA: hypothetical protein VHW46_16180 [Terracidiphilus sp.]|nr:hypothetical protein [Terracidiphilus sp.]